MRSESPPAETSTLLEDELRKPGTLAECIEAAAGAMTVCARGSRTPLSRRSLCCWAARFRPAGPQRASADDQLVYSKEVGPTRALERLLG